jgi:signal recognition particle receptor subunit beta
MVVLNYTGEEINAKIVYYGPGLSGKTTNLEQLYGQMPMDSKGQMVSMKTRTDRTLFFDFFPLELGEINGYRARFLLYTVPGQVYYNATRKLVLKGADAVVFVADSDVAKLQENIESLRNLEDNLNEHGMSLDNIPWVIQYNKRDLPDISPVATLDQHLNLLNVPAFEAVATTGEGVHDTFKCIADILYEELKRKLESGEAIATSADGDEMGIPGVSPAAPADPTETLDSVLREVDGPSPQTSPVAPSGPVAAPANANTATAAPVAEAPAPEPAAPETPWNKAPGSSARPAPAEPAVAVEEPKPAKQLQDASQIVNAGRLQDVPETDDSQIVNEGPMQDAQQPVPDQGAGKPAFSLEDAETRESQHMGRILELDETQDPGLPAAPEASPEFITDPMQRNAAPVEEAEVEADNPPVVPEPEPVMESEPAPEPEPVPESKPVPKPEPVVAPRPAPEPEARLEPESYEIVVPIVVPQSRISKTVPLKLTLKIQVVDD